MLWRFFSLHCPRLRWGPCIILYSANEVCLLPPGTTTSCLLPSLLPTPPASLKNQLGFKLSGLVYILTPWKQIPHHMGKLKTAYSVHRALTVWYTEWLSHAQGRGRRDLWIALESVPLKSSCFPPFVKKSGGWNLSADLISCPGPESRAAPPPVHWKQLAWAGLCHILLSFKDGKWNLPVEGGWKIKVTFGWQVGSKCLAASSSFMWSPRERW